MSGVDMELLKTIMHYAHFLIKLCILSIPSFLYLTFFFYLFVSFQIVYQLCDGVLLK